MPVATMASLGRVLLQHKLPLITAINSVQGGLRTGATIPACLHTGEACLLAVHQQLMEHDEFICQVRERLEQV
jgi:hypothetical protein